MKRTALYESHTAMGAKMVDFAGWEMPIHYGSQLDEHHQVRNDAGMFDVSHMAVVDLQGSKVRVFLQRLLANDVGRLQQSGKALYSCMLNEQGGIIDDLIVYFMQEDWFRMVVNAGTREKDLQWIRKQAVEFGVEVSERESLAMIAIQGPWAIEKVASLFPASLRPDLLALKRFFALEYKDMFIARTGYTGEDGFEIILPAGKAAEFWSSLSRAGVKPIGLGARDTLRLEAGMNLYGSDMDDATTPLESGLAWTVVWDPADRDFIGRKALELQKQKGVPRKLVGLKLEGKGILRGHQKVVVEGIGEGETTSGTFSPTLKESIAFARVPAATAEHCGVDIRGKLVAARIVKYPFIKSPLK